MFARILFALMLMLFQIQQGRSQGSVWQIKPNSSTQRDGPTAFEITDDQNNKRTMYTESRAVLIMESKYEDPAWSSVEEPANENENRLRRALEERGFEVDVWKNLKSAELKTVLNDVFSNYGNLQDGRLFFYYYGHGYTLGSPADPNGTRTFIVPIDSPDPASNASLFRSKAVFISQLAEYAKQSTTKHVFFALEACRAGAIIASLGGGFPVAPKGYLLSPELQNPARQFLTAGSAAQDIPAKGEFTNLIIEGLSNADLNEDGYVTALELMQYVYTMLPQRAPGQKPEFGKVGSQDGDMIIGASSVNPATRVQSTPTKTSFQYPLCRHPDHGLEGWSNSLGWNADSGWRGGGSDPLSFCNSQKVTRERTFPDRNVTIVRTSEDHRATFNPFKHDEYLYSCQFKDVWGPIYKEARSASCGHL